MKFSAKRMVTVVIVGFGLVAGRASRYMIWTASSPRAKFQA